MPIIIDISTCSAASVADLGEREVPVPQLVERNKLRTLNFT